MENDTHFSQTLIAFYNKSLGGTAGQVFYTLLVLIVGGLCEVGGSWLVWQVLRNGRSAILLLPGSIILVLYGAVMTLNMLHFSRAFATYGGLFIFLSFLWGWIVDHQRPDRWDAIGTCIALVGVAIIAFVPRESNQDDF